VIDRPRLLRRLDLASPLTLLQAPPGFGKSTVAAQWSHQRRAELVVWVSLSPGAVPTDLWGRLDEALVDVGVIRPPGSDSRTPRQLGRAIAASSGPVTVVIDNFERIPDAATDEDLLDLLRSTTQLRLIVCMRGTRHFPPQRRLDLDVERITADDLVLTQAETLDFLIAADVPADAEQADVVWRETGGWVELTRSVASALAGAANAPRAGAGEAIPRSVVKSAVATELRDRLRPELTTAEELESVLACTLIDDTAAELELDARRTGLLREWLEANGALSADGAGFAHSWPASVRRALAADLVADDPERAQRLHERVARWHLDRQRPLPALLHAVQAAQWRLATEIIEQSLRGLLFGHRERLCQAIVAIPLDAFAGRPRALAMRDMLLDMPDDAVLPALPVLPSDHDSLVALGESDRAAEILDTGLAINNVLRRRGLFTDARRHCDKLEVVAHAARAMKTSEVASFLPAIPLQIGITRLLADEQAAARRSLQEAFDHAQKLAPGYICRDAAGKIALSLAVAGETAQAAAWLERHEVSPATGCDEWWRRTIDVAGHCARALIELDRLRFQHVDTRDEDIGVPSAGGLWAHQIYVRGMTALHLGNPAHGLGHLIDPSQINVQQNSPDSAAAPMLAALHADLLLALGLANKAHTYLFGPHAAHPRLRLGQARLALLAGQTDKARQLAQDPAWAHAADRRLHMEILLIRAIAEARAGHLRSGAAALGQAVSTARPVDALRPFTTVPRSELFGLAAQLSPADQAWLDSPALRDACDAFPAAVDLIEMSDRELVILQYIANNMSGPQIAQRLFISYNTVKFHLQRIYHKLNANTRAQALASARTLGFIPDVPARHRAAIHPPDHPASSAGAKSLPAR
jgi:LuxR family maltose regulon positive regulatory protein